jgi:SAM-dependent methyltransferase
VNRILDLPSGYGRVLRWLVAGFPGASITACDTNVRAVEFVSKHFDVKGVVSDYDIAKIDLPVSDYDLIWCGSLFTHFDEGRWVQLFELFRTHMSANGILVFTTHGRIAARVMRQDPGVYGVDATTTRRIIDEYDKNGWIM